jgi:hypothetical protein
MPKVPVMGAWPQHSQQRGIVKWGPVQVEVSQLADALHQGSELRVVEVVQAVMAVVVEVLQTLMAVVSTQGLSSTLLLLFAAP